MWYIKLCHVTIAADYILLLRTTIVVCHTGYVVKQQLSKLFLDLSSWAHPLYLPSVVGQPGGEGSCRIPLLVMPAHLLPQHRFEGP